MKRIRLLLMAVAMVGLWGCNDEEVHINVDPAMLYGQWNQDNSQYYWTFNSDGTGTKVNRGEVEEGDENNGDFTWTLSDGDQLETVFTGGGELGGIYINKTYTIREISTTTLRWEDIYGRVTPFTKVN